MGRRFYFELRAWVPLLAYAFYLLAGNRVRWWGVAAATVGYLVSATLLIIGMRMGIQLRDFIGVSLSYESAVEGMMFGFIVTLILGGRPALACLSSVLCLSAVGWLYEVPFWNPVQMFITPMRSVAPLAVNTQIISLILLTATLWRGGWRPGRLTLATFVIYVAFSVYLFAVYPNYLLFVYDYRRWVIRLPSYALLLAVIYEASDWKRVLSPRH